MQLWKRNLVVIWLAQFFSILSFSCSLPFAPYYMQQLGVSDPAQLKLWVMLHSAATPLMLAVCSPIWGYVADRYGRRLMMLRSHLAAAVVLCLMGAVESVQMLIVLRLFQGALTGTVTAAQIMVAASTPSERSGTALGALSAAIATGGMAGAALGGILAHFTNYRIPFFVGGAIQVLTFFLVFVGTRETFTRKRLRVPVSFRRARVWLRQLSVVFPLLGLIIWVSMVKKFDQAFLPLLVQDIHGSLEGVSLWAGAVNAVGGVAGLVAGFALGFLADRIAPARLARWSSLGAGFFMLLQALAASFMVLLPLRFGMLLCDGGLEPALQAWLAKTTPPERRGLVFGWAGSARAVGYMLAPLSSGVVAAVFGIRPVFVVGAVLFALTIPVISIVIRRQRTVS